MQQAAVDPAVVTFAELVRRFCAWADSQPGDPLAELKQAQLLLSELQFRVLQLPDLGCGDSVELQPTPETNHAKLTARFRG